MSNLPPVIPYDQPPPYDYFPPAEDNAEKLVRLAVIFNYISVGLDFAGFLLFGAVGTLFLVAPGMIPLDPTDPPPQFLGAIYLALAVVMLVFGIVKVIGTRILQKAGPGAWGWGLAVGIIGCAQLLCSSCCCLQGIPGIYTVIVLCFQNVRRYLALRQQQNAVALADGPVDPPPFGS